jgi:hypothetical protein
MNRFVRITKKFGDCGNYASAKLLFDTLTLPILKNLYSTSLKKLVTKI